MKLFRIVGIIKDKNNNKKEIYESWGKCDLSIQTLEKLNYIYNIKYNNNWYMEFKEEN